MKSQKNVFDDEIPHKNGGFDVCETLKYETPPRKDGKKMMKQHITGTIHRVYWMYFGGVYN
jgi:hypothetical protein